MSLEKKNKKKDFNAQPRRLFGIFNYREGRLNGHVCGELRFNDMPVVETGWWLLGDELDGNDQAGREQSVRCQRGYVQVKFRGRKGQSVHVPAARQ